MNMKSILALFAVLALFMITNTSHARPGAGGHWHVMKGDAMPMNQDLMDMRNSALSNRKSDTTVAEDIVDEKLSVDESNPIPDLSIYHGDSTLKGKNSYVDNSDPMPDATIDRGDSHLKGTNSNVDESDPIPDMTKYHGDSKFKGENSYEDDSNPIPDLSIYHGDSRMKGENSYEDESNPIPDVSIYHGDSRMKGKECKFGDLAIMGVLTRTLTLSSLALQYEPRTQSRCRASYTITLPEKEVTRCGLGSGLDSRSHLRKSGINRA
ncbi:hypothetical protein POM88_042696 [Heracleum sosnowskyi]|uniref:Uncharacterized protein n=1 Tax=Heracleum sosnowskyi TaxID=360622 RepID=A0AAD8HJC1_9APIA|nr:hypothetical protein POM88_042696 [Heracleum sosnowskyi]